MFIRLLTNFFMWLTIINGGIFILSTIMIILMKNIIYKTHGKMFDLSKESINNIMYAYLGFFKIIFIVFNLVPYIVLSIIV